MTPLPLKSDESFVTYSEFRDSNWYIYWDTGYSRVKNYQLLLVWHIEHEQEVYYDYMHLEKLVKANNACAGLSYRDKIPQEDKDIFSRICLEFVTDVEIKFPDE